MRNSKITLPHILSIKWLTLISQSQLSSSCETVARCCKFPGSCPFSREKKERKNDICLLSLGYACKQQVHFVSLSCEWQAVVGGHTCSSNKRHGVFCRKICRMTLIQVNLKTVTICKGIKVLTQLFFHNIWRKSCWKIKQNTHTRIQEMENN